ncbi:DNA sulfur modification protein DndD [Marinobacter salarius]|uniref:DNA sulfur modification protein DndD n=1 Tax=Marinobacter salarius TaxID=1420917 RepID=UPI001BD1564D|nr:DNA sulfur modification protein DndD [Marinobacter salarius]MBS8230289.1 DNA sulfur modification protein DndD [Marinobacter salarius]
MLIQELKLTDFRVYAGENRFDLTPSKRFGKKQPIILFGGLNGAGKTSILSGVRLALYGRASLGNAVSQKNYDEFLLESIHHSRETSRTAGSAAVELTFSYAKLGVESQFHIRRAWQKKPKGVKEHLTVSEDGKPIKGLNQEQAQNFLNELIPIGVSDLFFFDGEKIAELADDTGGTALEHSIKKLLGLDVVERLSGDLTVLNRNLTKNSTLKSIEKSIVEEQETLDKCRDDIEQVKLEITTASAEYAEVRTRSAQLQKSLDERGSHFSAPRKELEKELDNLNGARQELISRINGLLADTAPLALAEKFGTRVVEQINLDLSTHRQLREKELLGEFLNQVSMNLKSKLDAPSLGAVEMEFSKLIEASQTNTNEPIIHDITPAQAGNLLSAFATAKRQKTEIKSGFDQLEELELKIDEIGAALARAPDDLLIANDFENFQDAQQKLGKLEARIETLRQRGRNEATKALDSARRLDRLYEEAAKNSDRARILEYIQSTNGLLREFVDETASEKIKDLEKQFTECFSKLARKDDLALQIRIDPKTFNVTLLSANNREIVKDELSAGEKQIFAIAVLEALAKTSGRQLPMIVDTPLGRLDSKHRNKLVEGYFPSASHQMVILSTDTEVDESFYQALSPDISRAYKLDYDPALGATKVEEGYFWQTQRVG